MASSSDVRPVVTPEATEEHLILEPGERRDAVLKMIRSARERIVLSLFRCTDFRILDELGEALQRKVQVRMLMTPKAKGWEDRLRQLESYLLGMGAEVRRYAGPVKKYHAKYLVTDDGPALVASLNFTYKCFDNTCDFLLITHDREVVSGLYHLFETDWLSPASTTDGNWAERLIVGPEATRVRFTELLAGARKSIRIIDHKVVDPAIQDLLAFKQADGVAVEVLGAHAVGRMISHGKMILIDNSTAVIGSVALSPPSLDSRREVAIIIRNPTCVSQLNELFQRLSAMPVDPAALALVEEMEE